MGSMVEEVPFTELIQRPARTAARLADIRALRLRRRDADDLMLMSADRAEQEGEVVDLTARLLAGVLAEHGGADLVRRVLPTVLAWTRFLPPAAVDELAIEFVATVHAAAEVGTLAPVSQLLVEWRHTAELHAALTRAHEGDHGPVTAPGAPA